MPLPSCASCYVLQPAIQGHVIQEDFSYTSLRMRQVSGPFFLASCIKIKSLFQLDCELFEDYDLLLSHHSPIQGLAAMWLFIPEWMDR